MEVRFLFRAAKPFYPLLRYLHTSKLSLQQANPIGDYYTSILQSSSFNISSNRPTQPPPSTSPIITTVSKDTPKAEPAILFSSRLSSPLERRTEIMKKSTVVAGIMVPPRPDEPDNCCMSGCVNCVWDVYRDDLEEWAAATKQAEANMHKEMDQGIPIRKDGGWKLRVGDTMTSIDDDGDGSEGLWGTGLDKTSTSEDLFKGVPVGIREFMKQEKRLREKHAKEAASGG